MMETPVHLPYREGLRNWLRTATKRLCIEAKWRIYQEILAHYNEAVEAHQEEGLSEDDAHDRALASLGSARKAAREFRRTHLTVRQAKWLQNALEAEQRTAQNRDHRSYNVVLSFPFGVLAVLFVPFLGVKVIGLFVSAVSMFVFGLYLTRAERGQSTDSEEASPHHRSVDEVVLMQVFEFGMVLSLMLFLMNLYFCDLATNTGFALSVTVVTCLVLTAGFVHSLVRVGLPLSIWRKLRRGADFTDPRGRLE
jgi:hypothetical protein